MNAAIEREVDGLGTLLRASVINPKDKRVIQRGEVAVVEFALEDVGIVGGCLRTAQAPRTPRPDRTSFAKSRGF